MPTYLRTAREKFNAHEPLADSVPYIRKIARAAAVYRFRLMNLVGGVIVMAGIPGTALATLTMLPALTVLGWREWLARNAYIG